MPKKLSQILAITACTFIIACGTSTNERGIASTTTDPSAKGSAYRSYDGFAPATNNTPAAAAAPGATTTVPAADTVLSATPVTGTVPVAGTAAVTPATTSTTPAKPAATAKPAAADDGGDIKKGEALISKSDCVACHKVDVKVLGPAYKDVAAKYPNNAATVNQLVEKVKKGGSGVWGPVPMSPHPALSDDDAKAMVRYILSLK
ncbi:c-type cytochrome [Daejeonella lutea]|uniref:Cytochrome c551/c552 n=1 Tax=Daejeonella lutea TaxID=572036 RepID=A0A1T5AC68_9SPHI|nr:c-type cytochrome [Daejeonella lutea]SKB32554.1 Cytochrome c551/c552 [Daejeonella lutea]